MSIIYVPKSKIKERGPIRAVIYDRYSSNMQNEATAGSRQDECKKYAVEQNMIYIRTYADYAETGTSVFNRLQYQKLLSDAFSSERDFDVILVFHSSRWGRGYENIVDEHFLNKIGVKIIWVSQPGMEADTPEVQLIRGIIQQVDAYFSKCLGRYTFLMQSQNTQRGFSNGGKVPDGYVPMRISTGVKDKKGKERYKLKYQLDQKPGPYDLTNEPRWKWIRYAIDLVLKKGKGLKTIVRELTVRGWRQKSQDKPLARSNVRDAFTNPNYTGHFVWGRKKWHREDWFLPWNVNKPGKKGTRKYVHIPPEEWKWSREQVNPAILSKDEFEQLNKRFGIKPPKQCREKRQLLPGITICHLCNSHLIIHSKKKKGKVYKWLICRAKHEQGWNACPLQPVSFGVFNQRIRETFLNRILTEREIIQFINAFNGWLKNGQEQNKPRIKEIEKQIAQIDREIVNFNRAIASAPPDADLKSVALEISKNENKKTDLTNEKKVLQRPIQYKKLFFKQKDLKKWLQTLKELFHSLTLEQQRTMLKDYIKKVEVYPGKKAKIIYDPSAILTFKAYREFPPVEEVSLESKRNTRRPPQGRKRKKFCLEGSCGGGI